VASSDVEANNALVGSIQSSVQSAGTDEQVNFSIGIDVAFLLVLFVFYTHVRFNPFALKEAC
jgi:hypothetical protein